MPSDVEIAKPFINATINVLSTMAMIDPKPGKPFVKQDGVTKSDVSAVIGVTGVKTGSISVSFPKKTAIAVLKAMLGDDIEDIVQDTKDTVGEIANMISGQARAGLAEMGIPLQGSTPMVIMGEGHSIAHVSKTPVIGIPFTTPHGEFYVEFSFE